MGRFLFCSNLPGSQVFFLKEDTSLYISSPLKTYEVYIIIIPIFTGEKLSPCKAKEHAHSHEVAHGRADY